ncbi:hypothetical protein FRC02_008801 [Tulasnella sp. 418]|nr:hypothetical protein FRC02_008801 [Tulasnella sp. 418]
MFRGRPLYHIIKTQGGSINRLTQCRLEQMTSLTTDTKKNDVQIRPAGPKTWPGGLSNGKSVLRNTPGLAHTPMFLMWAITIGFNKSSLGQRFYDWMNANYTSMQIHSWGTFIVTSSVYWILGIIFMIADLTERPKWLLKYKLQPWKRVSGKEYAKICLVVLRNQVLVAGPMAYIMGRWIAPWRGMRTDAPLPGAIETLYTWVFCMICMEVSNYRFIVILVKQRSSIGRLLLCPSALPPAVVLFKDS